MKQVRNDIWSKVDKDLYVKVLLHFDGQISYDGAAHVKMRDIENAVDNQIYFGIQEVIRNENNWNENN